MAIARPQILLTVTLGLIFSGFSITSALAAEKSEHSHSASHDHNALTTEKEISTALAALTEGDRAQAVAQRFCPIMGHTRLGADGTPHKVMIGGTPVFVCCEGCIEDAEKGGKATLTMVKKQMEASATLAKLPAQERAAAEAQKYCAVMSKNFLGSMGPPIKFDISGQPVYLCCKGCVRKANANPAATLATAEALRKAGEEEGHDHGSHDHKGHEHGDHKH